MLSVNKSQKCVKIQTKKVQVTVEKVSAIART